ncbi:ribonuclease H-like domain-containing protein, partial [Tanacetum coccineum]
SKNRSIRRIGGIRYGVLGELLDTAHRMEIVLVQNVDQSILYGVSADVDTTHSSKSGNEIHQAWDSTRCIRACALRNFDLGKMKLENSQNNALAKLPMLKLGEYEMWEIRIKQYFQIQDIHYGCNRKCEFLWLQSFPDEQTRLEKLWFLDDLYNNFKIVEQKVKRTVAANNDDKNLAFLTTSSPSSTNTINTVNTGVSTGNTKVNTASTETSTASFSDATVYAFLSTQPQGSQLVHEDLEQIHDDDLEEMDLKWNMALLSMRARKFYQRTGRKIIIDGSSTAGYDKSKVECFNCHKMGHFARECRAPRSKDNRNWNQGSSSKAVRIEDASEKAMCAIDGAGFDWSDMAEDEIQANMALMAFTDSEYDDLLVKLDDTAFKTATYKRGLSILEAQVVKYKESEVLFSSEEDCSAEKKCRDSSLKPTTVCDKESNNSKENTDDSLTQQPKSVTETSSVVSPLKTGLKTVKNAKPLSTVRSVPDLLVLLEQIHSLNDKGFVDKGWIKEAHEQMEEESLVKDSFGAIYEGKTPQTTTNGQFAFSLSQEEPKRVSKALNDPAWVEAMQEELLQFKLQNVWSVGFLRISPMEVSLLTLISDYAGADHMNRSQTTWRLQFLGNRLISWQCKKQTVVATSTTEAEYVAAASCCGQVLWIQNQLLDYGTAETLTDDNGGVKINATIDGHSLSITEGSLRRHLKLDDHDGLTSIPTTEIFEQLALMGYHTDSDKLTFQKGAFSPQWRFIQICLDMQKNQFQQHTRTYLVPSLTMKVFSNMKRPTKGFSGQEVALFPTMLDDTEPSPSPSRITSSPSPTPSPSPQPSPSQPSPTQSLPTQPSPTHPGTEYHLPTPHDSPLHAVHSHGSDEGSLKLQELMDLVNTLSDRIGGLEADLMKTKKTYSSAYTKLILRVKKLESQIKIGKARRQARVVLSDDEVFEDDSSKQGRKLFDEEVQEKASTDTELFIQEVTPTEVIQTQDGSEKASDEVSTAGLKKGTASEEVPTVSTAEVNLSTAGGTVTYSRRSAEKRSRQDKGKSILIEEEPKKKSKKELEQERLNEEIARQWDEEERKRAMDEAKTTKKIDWNDPSVIRYHSQKMKPKTIAQARRNMIKYLKNQGNFKISHFKGMSYNDIRPIFEKIWDFNQNIVPMDTEHGSGKQKSPQKSPVKSPAKEKSPEKVYGRKCLKRKKHLKEGVKEPAAKRKRSPFLEKRTRKRQS